MKTKLISLVISLFAAVAVYGYADIYEIRPSTQYGLNASDAYPCSYEDPLGSGSSNVYFTIRLALRGGGSDPNKLSRKRYYSLKWLNEGEPYEEWWDQQQNPLKIGIYVSGQLRYATYQGLYPNVASGTNFYDCVFMYKPQPGDFALPVYLAVEGDDGNPKPAFDNSSSAKYYFEPESAAIWQIYYHDLDDSTREGPVGWTYLSNNAVAGTDYPSGLKPSGDKNYEREFDYSLAKAGIYVKTIDFEGNKPEKWDDPEYWRTVAETETEAFSIRLDTTLTNVMQSATFYVWSMDEEGVKVVGDDVEITTGYVDGTATKKTVQMATVTVGSDGIGEFEVYGVASNRIAQLVLSPWKGFNFQSTTSDEPLLDYSTTLVKCLPQPAPKVYVSFDKDRPSATTSRKLMVNASTNFNDRASEMVPLYVTLSQAYEKDLQVQVKVKYEKDATVDPIKEKFLSLSQNSDEYSSTDIYYTNLTFKAGGDLQQTIYVYPLGGNADTKSEGIGFYPVIPDAEADALYEKGERALLQINSLHTPVIWQPKNDYDYGIVSGAAGEGFDISLLVNDCLRDMENTNGFTVTFGGALKSQPATNFVFTAGEALDFTVTGYDKKKEGVQTATIKVSEPLEPGMTAKSAIVQITFTVAVEQDKLSYVSLYDTTAATSLHDGTLFNEGTAPIPMFYVNEPMAAGESLYFFLKPLNEQSSNLVSCALFTQGVELVGGQTNTVRSQAFALNLLDGCAKTESTGSLEYEIVARTGSSLSDPESTYYTPAQKLVINVANVNPTIKQVKVNNALDAVANNENVIWKYTIPSDVDVPFLAKLSDPSKYFDVSNGLATVWFFSDGRNGETAHYEFQRITNNTDVITVKHKFTYTGGSTQDVAVVVVDKDMLYALKGNENYKPSTEDEIGELYTALTDDSQAYYSQPYRFKVAVGKRPGVQVYFETTDEKYAEEVNGKSTIKIGEDATDVRMRIELNEPADGDVVVRVTVTARDKSDPGKFSFVGVDEFLIADGLVEPDIYDNPDYEDGVVVDVDALDGTKGSAKGGFDVAIEVIDDGYQDEDYYLDAKARVYVENVAPVISPEPDFYTNTVSIGESFVIEWAASDVSNDCNAVDSKAKLSAVWRDGSAEIKSAASSVTNDAQQTTTLSLSSAGLHKLVLTVSDKDGGKASREWYYYIEPTKALDLKPVGPLYSSKVAKYGEASGRGRVWADGTPLIEGFLQTWNYGVSVDYAQAYAFGYAANEDAYGNAIAYYDDGTLDKHDIAITADGNSFTGEAVKEQCYRVDGAYDNYLYRWIHIGTPGNGGISTNEQDAVLANVSPLTVSKQQIGLDQYSATKSSYATRTAEAIFSQEYRRADNCGDINGDGIPDRMMIKLTGFGVFNDDGELIGTDMKSFANWNDDGDFLPGALSSSAEDLVSGFSNAWFNASAYIFDAKTEIRGYGEDFNDAISLSEVQSSFSELASLAKIGVTPDVRYTDPSLDDPSRELDSLSVEERAAYVDWCASCRPVLDPAGAGNLYDWIRNYKGHSTLTAQEYAAFVAWCARQEPALDPAEKGNWKRWSPERPTDPTKADTDEDGIPDGWEYYCWYRAHVGDPSAGTNLVRMTGRRYNPARPCEPDVISPDEIEKVFDPLVKNTDLTTTDTDNDGLSDLVEFYLGTNPFDFDTDGDGLPDGYEVTISETDPGEMDDGTSAEAMALNPRLYSTDKLTGDGARNDDGDAMAAVYTDGVMIVPYLDEGVSNYVAKLESGKMYRVWRYRSMQSDEDGNPIPCYCRGRELSEEDYANLSADEDAAFTAGFVELHYQVYQSYGFDPRTAWGLSPTVWEGHICRTVPFTALDEFLTMAFYHNAGGLSLDEITPSENNSLEAIWTKYTTNPANADTDEDGMPDGWELFTQVGPVGVAADNLYGPDGDFSPLKRHTTSQGTDIDGLDFPHEFSGIACVAYYSNTCSTITLLEPKWQNKIWPTDPWNYDTDGDGLWDDEEFFGAFVYGDKTHTDTADYWDTVPGGGLNPLSWDTDKDGLPDPWEFEFPGSASVSTNSSEIVWAGGMDGTVNDAYLDYDSDGLWNWQEYMVGAMRCWRYDDTISNWKVHECLDVPTTDEEWYNLLVNPASPDFNQTLANEYFDPGAYFSCATNSFEHGMDVTWRDTFGYKGVSIGEDPVWGQMYMFKDGYYHDLRVEACSSDDLRNRWSRGHDGVSYILNDGDNGAYPAKYITCDPRFADTDGDTMDDYYELFHGLNPLLGEPAATGTPGYAENGGACRDIVFESWQASISLMPTWRADCNAYVGDLFSSGRTRDDHDVRSKTGDILYDFFQFPWMAGCVDVDPDGDNIRNQQEAILANVQAANTYLHTDPTPLWMTDFGYEDSLTHRYYMSQPPGYAATVSMTMVNPTFEHDGVVYSFADFPWLNYNPTTGMMMPDHQIINRWAVNEAQFSFEQNEGYDTDHDYLGDFEEAQGKTKSASDPQNFDDPLRRQAMYFGGKDDKGFLQTPIPQDEYDGDGIPGDVRRDFLYYTVECWAKADGSLVEGGADVAGLHTLVERAVYSGASMNADESYLRKNFLIGVKDGRWYTKFDSTGTDANQPVEITDGPAASTDWTHVAATYDGTALRLYVDGECRIVKETSIQPEHGEFAVTLTPGNEISLQADPRLYKWSHLDVAPRWLNSIIVGASATSRYGVCFDLGWIGRDQLGGTAPYYVITTAQAKMSLDYGNFFKGYIDEVRIWDGARTASAIADDVQNKTRYTPALAAEYRQKVYDSWSTGGSRAPTAGATELPADLRYHWDFDQLPGAVEKADVITAPAGFQTAANVTDAKARWVRPAKCAGNDDQWVSPWWATIDASIKSSVYTDCAWIPWIDNTVAHLPRFDGSTLDSVYWSADYAGASASSDYGYASFNFKRAAEAYSSWVQATCAPSPGEYVPQWTTMTRMAGIGKDAEHLFTIRGNVTTGGNLLPFGSAYPKRISAAEGGMWDGQGAADAWAQTGTDSTHNSLPDWWETIAKNQYSAGTAVEWDTPVDYNGSTIPAWQAYLRDLAKGMLPDGTIDTDYLDTRDVDHDGIRDWWEDLYRTEGSDYTDAIKDADNDGLSNYVEYMLSEVFELKRNGVRLTFNPEDAHSVNAGLSDYFFRVGSLYLGEIFTDHDRMDDKWEQQYLDDVSPYLYDAGGDPDGDGWSNFAEFQAGTDPTLLGAIGIDEVQINEYPVPTVEIALDYEGPQNIAGVPIVVKAWLDPELQTIPDAVWTIGGGTAESVNTEGTTNNVSGLKYIGMNPQKEMLFHLSPGSIVKGSVKFEYKDTSWILYDLASGSSWVYDSASAIWSEILVDKEIPGQTGKGYIFDKFAQQNVGTIDYTTGAVSLDLTKVSSYVLIDGNVAGGAAEEGQQLVSIYELDQSYIRVKWNAKTITGGTKATYYLADADERSTDNNSLGHLKEGRNTFIAFYDLDEDGKYTAGEPYGVQRDVDVGWNYAKVSIELTDTHPVTARFNAQDGTNDRTVLYGTESGNLDSSRITTGSTAGGKFERVRVVRTLIDDTDVADLDVPARVVLDKEVYIENEQLYITEADFLKDGLDIDWEYLASDIAGKCNGLTISNVSYRVVLGNGTVSNAETNNLLNLVFNRSFDHANVYAANRAVCLGPETVNSAAPVFKWYMPNGLNSYTAFRLLILDGSTVVWDSGDRSLPPRIKDATYGWRYEWQAPIYADDKLTNGKTFENNKNYTWMVRMENARYRSNESGWSDKAMFRMNVFTNSTSYGSIDVAVRYYGPDAVKTSGTIRVQAFETPDFSGTPVGQGYVYDLADLDSTDAVTAGNARILGLLAGQYYLRAFIDTNNDGVCQDWETWGFNCARDQRDVAIFSPKSVTVGPEVGQKSVVTVYLDDSDTDQDNLPDAWEMATQSSLTKLGVTSLDQTLVNGVAVKKSLSGTISASGSISSGLSVLARSTLSSPFIAAMACGVTESAGADAAADALVSAMSASEIVDDSVAITSLDLDTANRKLVIGVTGEVESATGGATGASFYTFDLAVNNVVTCKVWRKATLVDAEWTEIHSTTIVLDGSDQTIGVTLPDDLDLSSGFFMVTVEQTEK